MSERERPASLSRQALVRRIKGLEVADSPFNDVKFELGVILVVGVLLLLAQSRLDGWLPWVLLLGYGLGSTLWLIVRTRRVLHRQQRERHHGP